MPTNSLQQTSRTDLSELDNELPLSSLTHMKMMQRLGIAKSTLGDAKKRPNFPQWSKERDPDDISWMWNPEAKVFVPVVEN